MFWAALAFIGCCAVSAVECELISPDSPLKEALSDVTGLAFKGFTPKITRVEGDPMLKILRYSSEPTVEVIDGKLVVSPSTCGAVTTEGSGSFELSSWTNMAALAITGAFSNHGWKSSSLLLAAGYLALGATGAQAQEDTCEQVIEVEISSPAKSVGAVYMEEMLKWPDYDDAEDSMHWRPNEDWSDRVVAARAFRETSSGNIYNYRSKTLMGMASSRVLNEPPTTTSKDAVTFILPNVTRPDTDEEMMMLSVLEMQALLRKGDLTSVELTNIALAMLDKYDNEFNMNEVDTRDLALRIAAEADALFAAGEYRSFIQGIPFAVKDTYDVAGYATAYGSWEFMENIVETESPLVTFAVENYGVPLFKSSVPQMTWGTANYKGNVYSCLHGGFAGGAGNSGGSSLGSGTAVCLGVVPVAICEQTGSSCQSPAIANGISTIIPALGTFTRENNGLYSLESDRPGLLCRDVLSCAVFYNYMRGKSFGDPQSRDVPFADPSQEDLSTYSIAFVDNSNTDSWPLAWDSPFMGKRNNVLEALEGFGSTVTTYESTSDIMTPDQLYEDMNEVGVRNTQGFDWYWLNVEGFFETVFKYGGGDEKGPFMSPGPQYRRQNNNFDGGSPHVTHIGATAYAYLDSMWMFGYAAEMSVFPMVSEELSHIFLANLTLVFVLLRWRNRCLTLSSILASLSLQVDTILAFFVELVSILCISQSSTMISTTLNMLTSSSLDLKTSTVRHPPMRL